MGRWNTCGRRLPGLEQINDTVKKVIVTLLLSMTLIIDKQ
jgi:hypothetical protein